MRPQRLGCRIQNLRVVDVPSDVPPASLDLPVSQAVTGRPSGDGSGGAAQLPPGAGGSVGPGGQFTVLRLQAGRRLVLR